MYTGRTDWEGEFKRSLPAGSPGEPTLIFTLNFLFMFVWPYLHCVRPLSKGYPNLAPVSTIGRRLPCEWKNYFLFESSWSLLNDRPGKNVSSVLVKALYVLSILQQSETCSEIIIRVLAQACIYVYLIINIKLKNVGRLFLCL